MKDEKPAHRLPRKKPNEEKEKATRQAAQKCVATTKEYVIQVLKGNKQDLDELLIEDLGDLWDKAYSLGLRDMDRMHGKAEPNY